MIEIRLRNWKMVLTDDDNERQLLNGQELSHSSSVAVGINITKLVEQDSPYSN